MKRFTVEYALDNGDTIYYIFDTYFSKYLDGSYTDFNTAEGDCQELNDWEEIENYREYG